MTCKEIEQLSKAVTKLAKNNDDLYYEIGELQSRISNLEEELDHYKGINNTLHDLEEDKFNRLCERVYKLEQKEEIKYE